MKSAFCLTPKLFTAFALCLLFGGIAHLRGDEPTEPLTFATGENALLKKIFGGPKTAGEEEAAGKGTAYNPKYGLPTFAESLALDAEGGSGNRGELVLTPFEPNPARVREPRIRSRPAAEKRKANSEKVEPAEPPRLERDLPSFAESLAIEEGDSAAVTLKKFEPTRRTSR